MGEGILGRFRCIDSFGTSHKASSRAAAICVGGLFGRSVHEPGACADPRTSAWPRCRRRKPYCGGGAPLCRRPCGASPLCAASGGVPLSAPRPRSWPAGLSGVSRHPITGLKGVNHGFQMQTPDVTDATMSLSAADVFEGPEKKLEIFFSRSPTVAAGFRSYDAAVWEDLLTAANCKILHCAPSAAFDAYLLSESSLFVYSSRVILKTCGTTTLLLVLPKLLELARALGATLEHVNYSHLRYKFPQLQMHPHTSFESEQRYLSTLLAGDGHVAAVHAKIVGPPEGRCWYALCTEGCATAAEAAEAAAPVSRALSRPLDRQSSLPASVDDLFEIVMEGLPEAVCARFYEAHPVHAGATGASLARSMTAASGIGALLEEVEIDEWAFAPCGYSMNGSRDAFYYTIHVTPELAFSYASFETNDPSACKCSPRRPSLVPHRYASFETNDPAFRAPGRVAAVVAAFAPATCTLTLTSRRRERCTLPAYELEGMCCTLHEVVPLDPNGNVSVGCLSFVSADTAAEAAVPVATVVMPSLKGAISGTISGMISGTISVGSLQAPSSSPKAMRIDTEEASSEASSEDTCELPTEIVPEIMPEVSP